MANGNGNAMAIYGNGACRSPWFGCGPHAAYFNNRGLGAGGRVPAPLANCNPRYSKEKRGLTEYVVRFLNVLSSISCPTCTACPGRPCPLSTKAMSDGAPSLPHLLREARQRNGGRCPLPIPRFLFRHRPDGRIPGRSRPLKLALPPHHRRRVHGMRHHRRHRYRRRDGTQEQETERGQENEVPQETGQTDGEGMSVFVVASDFTISDRGFMKAILL